MIKFICKNLSGNSLSNFKESYKNEEDKILVNFISSFHL